MPGNFIFKLLLIFTQKNKVSEPYNFVIIVGNFKSKVIDPVKIKVIEPGKIGHMSKCQCTPEKERRTRNGPGTGRYDYGHFMKRGQLITKGRGLERVYVQHHLDSITHDSELFLILILKKVGSLRISFSSRVLTH